jgi:hypothetical protein
VDGIRYRSYVVRVWLGDPSDPADARVRIEWIAPGIEVETHGARAADLAARLAQAFDRDATEYDGPREMVADVSDRGRD